MNSYEVDIKQTEVGINKLSCPVFSLKIIQSSSLRVRLYPQAMKYIHQLTDCQGESHISFSNWKRGLSSVFLHTASQELREGCKTYESEREVRKILHG